MRSSRRTPGRTVWTRHRPASTRSIILDVMLPGMDGFEVLKQLRRTSDIPVLMLTSRGEEPDRIVGLEIGADDYLPKTFSTRELLARLRAVTRRATRAAPGGPNRERAGDRRGQAARQHRRARGVAG